MSIYKNTKKNKGSRGKLSDKYENLMNNKGFCGIDLMFVIVMICLMFLFVLLPLYQAKRNRDGKRECATIITTINTVTTAPKYKYKCEEETLEDTALEDKTSEEKVSEDKAFDDDYIDTVEYEIFKHIMESHFKHTD